LSNYWFCRNPYFSFWNEKCKKNGF
jgi:hypothetical protein